MCFKDTRLLKIYYCKTIVHPPFGFGFGRIFGTAIRYTVAAAVVWRELPERFHFLSILQNEHTTSFKNLF